MDSEQPSLCDVLILALSTDKRKEGQCDCMTGSFRLRNAYLPKMRPAQTQLLIQSL